MQSVDSEVRQKTTESLDSNTSSSRLITNTMELKEPASSYRAPFPFVPTITPAKPRYRLNPLNDKEESPVCGARHSRGEVSQATSRRSHSTPRYGSASAQSKWTFRSFDGDVQPNHTSTYERNLSDNGVQSMLEVERRLSRWAISSRRRLSDRSSTEDGQLDANFHNAEGRHSLGQLPASWSLPREAERSWNRSQRPIAELVGSYERSQRPKFERERSLSKRITASSRIPVSKMAESYVQSSRSKM